MEEVVDFLETNVLCGEIEIERDGEVTYPEISYAPVSGQPGMGKFPFHKTSSMVSELAPVILFLKYSGASGRLACPGGAGIALAPCEPTADGQRDNAVGERWCQGHHHDA